MQANRMIPKVAALAVITMLGGCATWHGMDRQEKGAAVGATGGAVVGAAVGGPVGAAVGAVAGGYAGKYEAKPGGLASANPAYGPRADEQPNHVASSSANRATPSNANVSPATTNVGTSGAYDNYASSAANGPGTSNASVNADHQSVVRDVQRELNDRGFDAGAVDGIYGPHTAQALRDFQRSQGLTVDGIVGPQSLAALGLGNEAGMASNNGSANDNLSNDNLSNDNLGNNSSASNGTSGMSDNTSNLNSSSSNLSNNTSVIDHNATRNDRMQNGSTSNR